ncbi:MAG TPA: ABC transporter permease [Thermoanaerobaculia bacterium]
MIELALIASVPLLLAVQGELVAQRAGMINLGIEGMLLVASMTAVFTAQLSGSIAAGIAGGIAGAALIALIFGAFAIHLKADQIVTGTAINLLALGVTGFVYRELNATFTRAVPHLESNAIVLLAWVAVPIALAWTLWSTPFGLRLRACGENPEVVRAANFSVAAHRWAALAIEALLVGVAGADLALALSSGFAENMTAGRGYIALSIVIFGRWKVKGIILGTALFGAAAALQYAMQAASRGVQFHLLLAIPYVVTLVILCGIAGRVRAPEALGKADVSA